MYICGMSLSEEQKKKLEDQVKTIANKKGKVVKPMFKESGAPIKIGNREYSKIIIDTIPSEIKGEVHDTLEDDEDEGDLYDAEAAFLKKNPVKEITILTLQESLSVLLAKWRSDNKFTQAEASRKIGMTEAHYNSIERGKQKLINGSLKKIIEALGLKLNIQSQVF